MYYLKHPNLGNRHVASRDEANAMQREGWTLWPRTKAQKAGIVTATAAPTVATAAPAEQLRVEPVASTVRNTLKLGKRP